VGEVTRALTTTSADALLSEAAVRCPAAPALWRDGTAVAYAELDAQVDEAAAWMRARVPLRGSRVAVWLDKRVDTVVALFAAMRAGHVAVPINPALRAPQVLACLKDCRAAVLVSDAARLQALAAGGAGSGDEAPSSPPWLAVDVEAAGWRSCARAAPLTALERHAEELAVLFYTSGSTGAPKGVMVTHANLLAGAATVNAYLDHGPDDRLLAALPLSFDAGFSQLTCAFLAGASVVLLDHLFPADVLAAIDEYSVTGITAVPPLYLQLQTALRREDDAGGTASSAATGEPSAGGERVKNNRCSTTLRYVANTGGHLPGGAWDALRRHWPQARPVAMYGLTEAFRASRLPPEDFERKPDSIGLAVPGGTRLHVLRADGSPCAADEPGELVQQGPLVSRGYWNDPARSAERFRPGPDGAPAVWSGDTVRRDAEGYLWFVGRDDEQIKTSGYRVSPSEIEAAAAAAGFAQSVAVGTPDAALGQAIVLVLAGEGHATGGAESTDLEDQTATRPVVVQPGAGERRHALTTALRAALPAWMVPRRIEFWPGDLPRNANGKFDRVLIRRQTLQRIALVQPGVGGDGND